MKKPERPRGELHVDRLFRSYCVYEMPRDEDMTSVQKTKFRELHGTKLIKLLDDIGMKRIREFGFFK